MAPTSHSKGPSDLEVNRASTVWPSAPALCGRCMGVASPPSKAPKKPVASVSECCDFLCDEALRVNSAHGKACLRLTVLISADVLKYCGNAVSVFMNPTVDMSLDVSAFLIR